MTARRNIAGTVLDRAGPVLVVVLAMVALWYVAAVLLNAPFQRDTYVRAKAEAPSTRPSPPKWC